MLFDRFGYAFPWYFTNRLFFRPLIDLVEEEQNTRRGYNDFKKYKDKMNSCNYINNNKINPDEIKDLLKKKKQEVRENKDKVESAQDPNINNIKTNQVEEKGIEDLRGLSRNKTVQYFRENLKNLSNANLYWLIQAITIELRNRDKTAVEHTTEV